MTVYLAEDLRPIILDLIEQLLAKGEKVMMYTYDVYAQLGEPGRVVEVQGNSVMLKQAEKNPLTGRINGVRFDLGADADEKYWLTQHEDEWMITVLEEPGIKITKVKPAPVAESSSDSLLKMLIKQRLEKGEKVRLDFLWDHGSYVARFRGYVVKMQGDTIECESGASTAAGTGIFRDRFVLPFNVDEYLTLHKVGDEWVVQKIDTP